MISKMDYGVPPAISDHGYICYCTREGKKYDFVVEVTAFGCDSGWSFLTSKPCAHNIYIHTSDSAITLKKVRFEDLQRLGYLSYIKLSYGGEEDCTLAKHLNK